MSSHLRDKSLLEQIQKLLATYKDPSLIDYVIRCVAAIAMLNKLQDKNSLEHI